MLTQKYIARKKIFMDLFVSKFINKVDRKGRISLPSLFRNALPKNNKNQIILYKSLKYNSIEGCNITRINEIANRINKLDIFSDDQDDFATSIFAEIIPTNLDKEGRFLIPENLKKHANILEQATFIGQGLFFQIWEPTAAIERQKQSRLRLTNKKRTLSSIISHISKENAK
jgi:MraZ protein